MKEEVNSKPVFDKEDLENVYQIGFNQAKRGEAFQKTEVIKAFCTADKLNKNINWEGISFKNPIFCSICGKRIRAKGDGTLEPLCECY